MTPDCLLFAMDDKGSLQLNIINILEWCLALTANGQFT